MERKPTTTTTTPTPLRLSQHTSSLVHSMIDTSNLSVYQKRELEKQLKGIETKPTTSPTKRTPGKNVGEDPFSSIKSYGPKKTHSQIMESDPYKRERYLPSSSSGDGTKQKEKLQLIMENHGKPKVVQVPVQSTPPKDRFDTLIEEIEDRKNFLEGMRVYGKAEKYEKKINQEIEVRIAELELLQKKSEKEKGNGI